MSEADDLAAVVASLRPVAEDLALPDTCSVLRTVAGPLDSRGNPTGTGEVIADARRCRIRSGALRPTEQEVADQIRAASPYAIDLPYETDATAADVLLVNGTRRFEVLGVLKDGGYGVFAVAICEERT